MKRILYGLSGLVLVASTATLARAGITYSNPVDNPSGVDFTQLYGVNDSGLIVGAYQTGGGLTTDNSFTYNGSSFTSINCPTATCANAEASESTGINNSGTTFGTYIATTGNFGGYEDVTGTSTFSTYLLTSGNCTGCTTGVGTGVNKGTLGQGINSSGNIVGTYSATAGTEGFYSANGSAYTAVIVGGVTYDALEAINNSGEIGGNLCPTTVCASNAAKFGFTESTVNGTATCFSAGTAGTLSGCTNWVAFGVAGANNTTVQGIDGNGDVVGFFTIAGEQEGYICESPTTTSCGTLIIVPPSAVPSTFTGAYSLQIFGINNLGTEFVGAVSDSNGVEGFIGYISNGPSTPEPGTLILTFSALGLLGLWGRKRRATRQ
jgi:hypothetical protein